MPLTYSKKVKPKKRILFCVLNWGLGHASRSIPLIRYLVEQQTEVILASDGRALELLRQEFPRLRSVALPAYNIAYPTSNMFWNIGIQLPKIYRAVRAERRFIQNYVLENAIDAIISDNRFGCYHSAIPSVFITHQVRIKIGLPILEDWVQKINQSFIRKFEVCWIPDFEGTPNLAGQLSQQHQLKAVRYLGALSRFRLYKTPIQRDLIVVLSGPEPQRTFFEKKVLEQIQTLDLSVLIVQGKTAVLKRTKISDRIEIVSFLTSEDLNQAILASRIVLCRAGYSSIMDLGCLQKQAILIPTPGQTEQEYLMEHFSDNSLFVGQKQVSLNIEAGLNDLVSKKINKSIIYPISSYKTVLQDFLNNI